MAEEGANALVELGGDDVFEAAGLLVRFGVFDGKCVGEQALSQAVAAHDIACAASSGFRESDLA